MKGILKLAYKLLANDKAKFTALLVGIIFASFSMIFISAMFVGVMNHSSSTIINIGASVWVMDPAVQIPANSIGMPDYVLDAVRSMKGVDYAVPLYSSTALVKLSDGSYQAAYVMGLDDTSLFGRPEMTDGNITDIFVENGFIAIQDGDYPKLGSPRVGSELQINDHRAVIVGTAKVAMSGLFGLPTLYTTYNRAIQYIPNPRFTISYVLVQPKTPADIPQIKQQVDALGYRALTKNEFMQRSIHYYIYQTGMGTNLLIMTVITFAVGLSVSGQTFYTFILENLERFGALKAIGTTSSELILMILSQVTFTALTGYGLGLGLCTLFVFLAKMRLPSYFAMITYANLLLGLIMVVIIAAVSSYAGVRRVLKIEPFEIFRG
ncbi:MAG TPA: ABC transporter permease [Acidobacteriota bacterium]|nr:ABC transporter permease [Acidobacteriota bacterium]